MSNNPFSEPGASPVRENALTPSGGGDAAERAGSATLARPAATAARSEKEKNHPINQYRRFRQKSRVIVWEG